jgi:hypothetical protein
MPKSKENPISAGKQGKALSKSEKRLIKEQEKTPYIAKKARGKAKG